MASKNGWTIKNGTAGIIIPLKKSAFSSSCLITLMSSLNTSRIRPRGMTTTGVTNVVDMGTISMQMKTVNWYGDVGNARSIR